MYLFLLFFTVQYHYNIATHRDAVELYRDGAVRVFMVSAERRVSVMFPLNRASRYIAIAGVRASIATDYSNKYMKVANW